MAVSAIGHSLRKGEDMDRERPRAREKNVTGKGTGLGREGSGLGTGPVGSGDGYSGRGSNNGRGGGGITRGAGLSLPVIIIIVLVYFLGGGNLLGGGGGESSVSYDYGSSNQSSGGSFGGSYLFQLPGQLVNRRRHGESGYGSRFRLPGETHQNTRRRKRCRHHHDLSVRDGSRIPQQDGNF